MLNYLKTEILEKYTKEKRKQHCLQISGQLASKVDEQQQQSNHFILNTSAKNKCFVYHINKKQKFEENETRIFDQDETNDERVE